MQGLADGYFVIPYTIGGYLAGTPLSPVNDDNPAFKNAASEVKDRVTKLLSINGKRTVDDFHKELGRVFSGSIAAWPETTKDWKKQ